MYKKVASRDYLIARLLPKAYEGITSVMQKQWQG